MSNSKEEPSYSSLVRHFFSSIWETKPGKLLLVCWTSGTVLSFILGAVSNRYFRNLKAKQRALEAKEAKGSVEEDAAKKQQMRVGLMGMLKPILRVGFPSLYSSASLYLALYTFFLVVRIWLTIKIAQLTGRLGKMVGTRTFTRMFQLQAVFGLWCIPAAIVNSSLAGSMNMLSLRVRQNLTKWIHDQYLSELVFYRASNLVSAQYPDLDQIITADVKKFSSQLCELYGNLLKPILEVCFISHTLSKLMGFQNLVGFYAFFAVAGQWLRFVMPPFAQIHRETSQLEGVFRANHARLINKAEEIAFYGGSDREKVILNKSFEEVVKLSERHHFLQWVVSILDSYLVKYGSSMIAYSMLIPAVYLGLQGLRGKSSTQIMQYYLTSTQLFIALGNACKNLVLSYKRIQSLTGITSRVHDLFVLLKEKRQKTDEARIKELAWKNPNRVGGAPRIQEGSDIIFENVDIFSPAGQLLARGLNFKVARNTNVLISGPNGSGKSSLFRVLAGLWPLCSGTLTRPPKSKLFYIPQQPYMTPGTLRDQVTYPLSFSSPERDGKLNELMELVELGYLVKREGGWNTVKDWFDVLSGGEKQRVAMARLFFHRPEFGILDECTSAVSLDVEAKIYETCKKLNITIFTVSHRPQLIHHHDYMLKFDGLGEGGWEWKKLEH